MKNAVHLVGGCACWRRGARETRRRSTNIHFKTRIFRLRRGCATYIADDCGRANMGGHAVQQASKFGQGFGRCHNLADFDGATRRWIGHPGGQSRYGPVRQVAVDVLASGKLGCSVKPQILAHAGRCQSSWRNRPDFRSKVWST